VGSTKSMSGHVTSNLCFCIRRDLLVKNCILVGTGCKTVIPSFFAKPSTHRMHDPGSIVPHIRSKVHIDNQMS
jgi:hypothetical protein